MDDGDFLHAINGDWDAMLSLMRANRQVAQRTDASGMTILHWVCLHQDAPTDIVVKVVFAYPYAVHVRNDAGHLPIELAIQAECSERTLEVLRAAANGSRRSEDTNGRTLYRHDLRGMTKDERGDPNRETIDYPLSFEHHHRMTEDGSESREGSEYQPHQNQTYFGGIGDDDEEEEDDVDADELEYQQRHCHYQSHSFQSQSLSHKNRRLERSVSDQEEARFDPLRANYNSTSVYGGYVLDAALERERDRGYTLSRSDPHVKSLLTEQRLRERENDLISIATAEDSVPLGLFDPSKGPAETTLMSNFIVQEEAKTNRGNGNISSRSLGAGPRSKMAFPPRWKQSRMCHVCACGFSLVKRRHHCRNCGQSVCSQHSINRVSLPKFALSEPQRVCDQCF
uniref:FYVE-type domain-containing protein n=1 Tax=Peronospora matthiolae TaxID=2874970 RepID=A0AAV1TLB1_9STRA